MLDVFICCNRIFGFNIKWEYYFSSNLSFIFICVNTGFKYTFLHLMGIQLDLEKFFKYTKTK